MAKTTTKKALKKADQYDDPKYNYQDYWAGLEYEHVAEGMALKRLLKGRHFKHAVDVGGGYGRLSKVLTTYADKGKRVPQKPVDISSQASKKAGEIPFVNHHPKTIIKLLNEAGFEVDAVLSGSNLRSPVLKRLLGKNILVGLEKLLQPMLAPLYFGPSVWLRLKKK